MTLPFTFGIPLIARAAARDWELVQGLLDLTLRSLAAQAGPEIRIVVAGHDQPRTAVAHEFLAATWPAEDVRADNLDSGRKKHAISQHVLATGGGLLMFVDADDWVEAGLVETARARIAPEQIGGLVEAGYVTDLRAMRLCPLPHPQVFAGGFHELCGSCAVAVLKPGHPDPVRRDPTAILHEHYRWIDVARELGVTWAKLDVGVNYLVNTSANHSETHGPFAAWRRDFNAAVTRIGVPADEAFLARFGLDSDAVNRLHRRFFADGREGQASGEAS